MLGFSPVNNERRQAKCETSVTTPTLPVQEPVDWMMLRLIQRLFEKQDTGFGHDGQWVPENGLHKLFAIPALHLHKFLR